MTRIEPNPTSPFADADPSVRHIFPSPIFFPSPQPGVLAVAGCERMAVVPSEPMRDAAAGDLPEGLCPGCLAAMRGEELPADVRPVADCRECGSLTDHDGLCAVCRQEAHEEWAALTAAADAAAPGGEGRG